MKKSFKQRWVFPLVCGAVAFAATLIFLESAPGREVSGRLGRILGNSPSGNNSLQAARTANYRKYVMDILQTRRSQPLRSPEEWMRFLASLDAWYRAAKVDCVTTLTAGSFGTVLRLVEEPRGNTLGAELLSIARETGDSATQIACYEELWRRTAQQGPQACAALQTSMPAICQPLFRDRLLKMWVEAKGIQSLAEIAALPSMAAEDVASAFQLCAKANPEACVVYLEKGDFQTLLNRFGSSLPSRGEFLFRACMHLPPERALDILNKQPLTSARSAHISTVVSQAVETNPQLAEKMIARDPYLVPVVCAAAYTVAFTKPKSAAEIINLVPGEQLRTSTARQLALRLSPAYSKVFVESLSDPLTRETVRAVVERAGKPEPAENTKPENNSK